MDPTAALAAALADAPPGPLCIGYSGGLDSTVLLHACAAQAVLRGQGLRALHVDHGLQPQSADWAAHCQRRCAELGVALTVLQVCVARDGGRGLEAAAREARHAAFAQELAAGETLVLAHHRDDQAETVLLRLLRASGSAGLAGMAALRRFGGGQLWRPLLALPRATLEAYARAHGLDWIDDPSNADPRHDRNLLRHAVLPVLRERWPGADAALARSARLLREDAERLERLDRLQLAAVQGLDPSVLSVSGLLALDGASRRGVVRLWLRELGLPAPPAAVIDRVDRLLDARADATPLLAWPGAELRRYRDGLHAMAPLAPPARDWSRHWDGSTPLALPSGFGILELAGDALRFDPPLLVAPRRGGERLRLPGRSHHAPLKDALQQLGVPPWLRERLPLLHATDGTLLAAGDLVLADAWHAHANGRQLRWTADASA